MIADKNTGVGLISDVLFQTQHANPSTCEIAARTISRQTSYFAEEYPGLIKNTYLYETNCANLCECVQSLKAVVSGSGEEIVIKRRALGILLMLSNQIAEPVADNEFDITNPVLNLAKSA